MLTDKDIKKLIKAQEKVFATKEDLEELKGKIREDFSNLQSAVESYAQKADTYFQEMVMLAHKVDRLEKWVYQIANKVGIKLKI